MKPIIDILMERNILKRLLASILAALALLLTGCQDMKNMDDEAYALSLGVDAGEERRFRFTVQVPSQTASAAEKGGFTLHSAEADSLYEAMDSINATLPWRLNFTHLNYILFSDKLAASGAMKEFMRPLPGKAGFRATCSMAVVKGNAGDFLEAMRGRGDINLAKHQRAWMLEPGESGLFPECTYAGLAESLESPIYSALLPIGSVSGAQGEGDGRAEMRGCALFKDGVMACEFDAAQALVLMLARGEFRQGWYYHRNGENFAVDLQLAKPREVHVVSWNPLVIRLSVFVAGDTAAGFGTNDVRDDVEAARLERAIAESLREDMAALSDQCLSRGIDAFQLGKCAVTSFSTNAQWQSYDWTSRLRGASVEIRVDCRLGR